MGMIVAKLKRPLRRFNVDNRARAVISKDKPTPAPQYEAAIKQLKLAEEANPNFMENHYKKDLKLDEYLKNIYVTSTDRKAVTINQPKSDRPLPQSRMPADFEFGFYIPDEVPEGKCSLKQIFDIITRHKEDSIKYNVDFLATEYKLDKETVEKLLHYYKLYHLLTPQEKEETEEFAKNMELLKKKGVFPSLESKDPFKTFGKP